VVNAADGEQSLIAHLLELRRRLLYAVLAVVLVFLVLLPFANPLYSWLAEPLKQTLPPGSQLVAIEVASTFFVPMKLAFFAALFISAPFILYQIWAFVAPALYDKEKRLARPLLLAASLLFYAGCAFTYFALLPVMFAYLNSTAPEGVAMMTDIGKYLDFVLVLLLAGGASFEVPIAVLVAVLLGWVSVPQLVEWRGYVIVAIFIVAAIITPPDGLSQIMLALPMWALYEVGIVAARALLKTRHRAEHRPPAADA
jgi:sec-independent protein translocase protein TatC